MSSRKKHPHSFLARVAIIVLVLLVAVAATAGQPPALPEGEPVIRVALIQNAPTVSFEAPAGYVLVNERTGAVVSVVCPGDKWEITRDGDLLSVHRGSEAVGAYRGPLVLQEMTAAGVGDEQAEADISASSGERLFFLEQDGVIRPYRGTLHINPTGDALTAVNHVPMEEYLYSVVPSEAWPGWPDETYKAQAVAARSFALYNMNQRQDALYDVCPTEWSQVYKGFEQENEATTRAVEATRGEILTCQGEPIEAYFHSSSGGHTENSEDVWFHRAHYIRAVTDAYDVNSREYNWQVVYSADELKDQLASRGYEFNRISDIQVMAMTASEHRVKRLLVAGRGMVGQPQKVVIDNADNVRRALGLKSSLFRMEKKTNQSGRLERVTLRGHGWGHGLGMSQWGACGMAGQGFGYEDILQYYYTGVTLAPDYGR